MEIAWSEHEITVLSKMDIPFDIHGVLTDENIEDLYEIVPDYMMERTDTGDDSPDSEYNICEDIITKLADILGKKGLLS